MIPVENYIKEQESLISKIQLNNQVDISVVKYIAGVDLAYWTESGIEFAVCCIVVLDFNTKTVVERKYCVGTVDVPYIPGCLAFREIPLFLKTKILLEIEPDVYMFDGNGYLHPRHMGIATQAGILIDKPSIGVAKTYFKINDIDFVVPKNEKFAYENIIINNEVYGRALRTQLNVKPVFLSIGNKIDIDTATSITEHMITSDSHIPLPTRLADIMTHEIRKKYRS